jgi:hypothetical protein
MDELSGLGYERSASAVMWPVSISGRLRRKDEYAARQTRKAATGDADGLKTGQQLRDVFCQSSAAG